MDRLSLFNGVRSGLSRSEFTELLGVFPIDSLRSLRAGLFNDACDLGLIPDGFHGLPLVDSRDSALRPVSKNVNNLSCEEIIRGLEGADADIIFHIVTNHLPPLLINYHLWTCHSLLL